ncbi:MULTISPECIES: hypothetical protein [unclassified Bacteroides]|uniref:hypothetical protein n=1 Tax=unclassified Bacteroides TaxID=2646097 RepID=UPI004062E292
MNIGLTIKSIIRWEQLTGKAFPELDYTSREDVEALLYTTTICNSHEEQYTFEVFRLALEDPALTKHLISELERFFAVMAQYQVKTKGYNVENAEPEKIGKIVSTLIMEGLSPDYALNDMELCDLPLYIEAYERKRKEEMEASRIWTYLTILPHVDSKKLKSARDIFPFPWELEDIRKEAERAVEEDGDKFEQFMKTKKSDYGG